MPELPSRRCFLRQSAAIAAGACTSLALTGDVLGNPSSRLKVGIVGDDRRALSRVVRECGADLVAHCGADETAAREVDALHPGSVRFDSPWSMIDQAPLDAVIICPDVPGSVDVARVALQRGIHVYSCPLGDSIAETRQLGGLAQRSGAITQVNLRSTSAELVQHIVEPLRTGAIGRIREVVCWSHGVNTSGFHTQGHLVLSVPMVALGLGHPTAIAAAGTAPPSAGFPEGMAVRYEFPRSGPRSPLRVVWYDGEWAPPYESVDGIELSECGALYLGESGQLLDDLGANRAMLLLDGQSPRELVPVVTPAHQSLRDWLAACSGQPRPLAGLESSAMLTQTVLAGLIAYRVQRPLDWDGPAMCARNCPQADRLIQSAIVERGSV